MKSEGSTTSVSLLLRLGHHPSDQAAWEEFVNRYGGEDLLLVPAPGDSRMPTPRM